MRILILLLAGWMVLLVSAQAEDGVVRGLELARPGGGYLGVEAEGSTLKVTFYDAQRRPAPADVARAAARWHDTRPRRTVLAPATAGTLVSPPVLNPPFRYVAFLVLLGEDGKERETHSFNLNRVASPKPAVPPVGGPS